MTHIILFKDNPSADPGLRQTHMASHLDFLQANRDRIAGAGPLFKTAGESAGGLWLVNEANPNEVERMIREDPFWPTGLRLSHQVLRWNVVFANPGQLRTQDGS
ncbi:MULTISPECIES: YciI family protein [Alphaproteobacteria]|uniref:YciI family protein n=1 Tax=Alphaproteobacteria TaxID=28211 RepID=UPI0012BB85BE|nr:MULTISPECIES: YciI family protein [Alphaproteobacteria]MTH99969.1 hypothetical protein [Roseibium sp. RKSG952]